MKGERTVTRIFAKKGENNNFRPLLVPHPQCSFILLIRLCLPFLLFILPLLYPSPFIRSRFLSITILVLLFLSLVHLSISMSSLFRLGNFPFLLCQCSRPLRIDNQDFAKQVKVIPDMEFVSLFRLQDNLLLEENSIKQIAREAEEMESDVDQVYRNERY